jgi:hypothetical protein
LANSNPHQGNPSFGNPEYHVPEDASNFPETYDFDLEYYLLVGGAGVRPPAPPESSPYTPRNELEENSEELYESKREPKDNRHQIIAYQSPNMSR